VEQIPVELEPYEKVLIQADPPLSLQELELAFRNRGMPLEGMRYDVTPTGMHYLLIHWDIPETDAASWRVSIGGAVSTPLSLTMDEIRARPAITMPVTMECAGNGRATLTPRPLGQPWLHEAIGTATWTGTPLRPILEEAGVSADAVDVVFTGADVGIQGDIKQAYQRSLSVADATRDEVMLAYAMNGSPLEPQHGAPVRLLVPGWYGMTSVKWLQSIEVITEPFAGYQQEGAYRFQRDADDDDASYVTRMRPRALMIPPGITDYPARRRFLEPGPITITGRAWSGRAPVTGVEVAVDGGWTPASLSAPLGEFAWRKWTFSWDATPGEHELMCRATDASGSSQPMDQAWNVQGVSQNHVQHVIVQVG
jgi:DMSO/TMAO reductase YedYZ molybdopterin-dependent catalytic subunit